VDMEWSQHALQEVTIRSDTDNSCHVKASRFALEGDIVVLEDGALIAHQHAADVVTFEVKSGRTYTIRF